MALIYETTMHPSKTDLLEAWLPAQPWFTGDVTQFNRIGSYRFDDPEGEVGMEGMLFTAGDETVYHVPLAYRGAALEAGEAFLLGTSDHGVLGKRWISDAVGDPVYRAVLAHTIVVGGREADETGVKSDGERFDRELNIRLRGSGAPDAVAPDFSAAQVSGEPDGVVIESGSASMRVHHVVDTAFVEPEGALTLRVTWPGQIMPVVIATLAQ